MHFQTSGYLPAIRDLIYPTYLRIAWRCKRIAHHSERDEAPLDARNADYVSYLTDAPDDLFYGHPHRNHELPSLFACQIGTSFLSSMTTPRC
jgi:hypothetical protein